MPDPTTNTAAAAVPLDDLSTLWQAFRDFTEKANEWAEAAAAVRKQIEARLGDAETGTIAGRPVVNFKRDGMFAAKKFTADHPETAAKYTRPVTKDELDTKTLAQEQPDLYRAYRARRFVPVAPKTTSA